MNRLVVKLKEQKYQIMIGSSLICNIDSFYPLQSGDKVMLVTDTQLSNLWKKELINNLSQFRILVDEVIIPMGEKYKNIKSVELILSKLIQCCYNRDAMLIAMGGGVIGDLTGFVASIYQRGIRYMQLPTTLLAQVDASIGGKTAINHALSKNMIGSFWQPTSVIIDINFLNTLPLKELISGMAEIVKYAIVFDSNFFNWLETNYSLVLGLDQESLLYCIKKCCTMKSKLIMKDEKENNMRAMLNLGHTYGHAIESFTRYSKWLHGEAISVGIVMAFNVSEILGKVTKYDVNRVVSLLKRIGLPVKGPANMPANTYLDYMKRDKKNFSNKGIRLVLPVKIGKVEIFNDVSKVIISQSIHKCS